MMGEVYGRIAADQQAERDMAELSRRVLAQEEPGLDEVAVAEASWYPLAGHPLVVTLADEDETGPGAALAYIEDAEEADALAVIRWMQAGAYKGQFNSDTEFCEDQFADAIADHMEDWTGSQEAGFPLGVDWGTVIDWDEIAHAAVGGPVMDSDDQVFYSIECVGGVYVFDASIKFESYRGNGDE